MAANTKTTVRLVSYIDFLATLKEQDVPDAHCAFKCPACGHVQSAAAIARHTRDAESAMADVQSHCEGSFSKEYGGCNWSLDPDEGLHKLEVEDIYGNIIPVFEPASPEEAKALMLQVMSTEPKCRICGCTNFAACPTGCFWVEEDLCSSCVE